jgi:hypothetical protein
MPDGKAHKTLTWFKGCACFERASIYKKSA